MRLTSLLLVSCLCLLVGCEQECDGQAEKDAEIARLMQGTSGIYVGGDAVGNQLDTVNAPVWIEGNAMSNDVNTAAQAAK
jgi:hypothetical protein